MRLLMLSGVASLDVDEWRAGTAVDASGGVPPDTAAARAACFFRALASLDAEARARVFQFATGLARLPCGGFGALQPPFTLQLLGASFAGRLPVAHTCFNALQLPPFAPDDEAELARLLVSSVTLAGDGFSLV